MENSQRKGNVRDFQDGEWYWIAKAFIQHHAPHIGTLSAVVYNLLASMADANQSCFPSQKYIAERLGCSRASVNKAIKRLSDEGLIGKEGRRGSCCRYVLLKVGCQARVTGLSTGGTRPVNQANTNNNNITRINNNKVGIKKLSSLIPLKQKEIHPKTREGLLALDIAKGLDDEKNQKRYLACTRKYPEGLLRIILAETREIPPEKIIKSRAAIFNHLLKNHDRKHEEHHRH